jgi:hypothetical protein
VKNRQFSFDLVLDLCASLCLRGSVVGQDSFLTTESQRHRDAQRKTELISKGLSNKLLRSHGDTEAHREFSNQQGLSYAIDSINLSTSSSSLKKCVATRKPCGFSVTKIFLAASDETTSGGSSLDTKVSAER